MAPKKIEPESSASRRAARWEAARRSRQRRRLVRIGVIVGVVAIAGAITFAVIGTSSTSTPPPKLESISGLGHLQPAPPRGSVGPEGVPIPNAPALAGAGNPGQTVDGIQCQSSEQTLFHIHAHLTVMVNGAPRQIPYGIGILDAQTESTPEGPFVASGACFTWLHTHAADGIIHIESPVQRTYTLGNFFDVWGQPLTPDRVGPAVGNVTVIYNGKHYVGNPRDVPLNAHAQIQLEVGRPLVAQQTISFPSGL